MKNNIKTLIICVLIFSNTIFAKELDKVSIQLQWLDQFQFAGYYIAKEKGFYKDVGLDVDIKKYDYGINPTDEVTSKKATYGVGRSSLIVDKSDGKKISLLSAAFQSSPFVLIAREDSGIKTIKDFVGKKIMVTPNAANMTSVTAMISKFGVTKKDIIEQAHTFDIEDLIDKETDLMASYLSNEPFVLKEKGIETTIFDPKDYGFDFYSDILFTSEYEIDNHHKRAINFRDASVKGWEYAFTHIDEAVNLIYKKYNAQNKTKKALKYEANELKKLAYYKTKQLGNIDKNKIQRIYDIYNVMGLLENEIDIDSFIVPLNTNSNIHFTKEEKEYLKNNPIIKAHNETSWAPFNYNENGVAKGFNIDYMNLIASKIGVDVEYVSGYSWAEFMKILDTPKLDVIINIVKTKEREKKISFTKSFYTTQNAIYVHKDNPYYYTIDDLVGKTISIPKDFFTQKVLAKEYPNIKQVLVKDSVEALKLLSLGRVDATIGKKVILDYIISHNNISGVLPTKYVDKKSLISDLRLGAAKKDKILIDILTKAQKLVSQQEFMQLKQKWFGVKQIGNNFRQNAKKYFKNNTIKACVSTSMAPIEFMEDGKHKGITLDIVKSFEDILNTKFKIVKTNSMKQSMKFLKSKKCDIIPHLSKDESMNDYAKFTKPFNTLDIIGISQNDNSYIVSLGKSINNKRISLPSSSKLRGVLKNINKTVSFVDAKTFKDMMLLIDEDKADMTFLPLPIYSYYKNKYNLTNTKIAGQTTFKVDIMMAVRDDDKALFDIINSATDKLAKSTVNLVCDKWTNIVFKKEFDTALMRNIIGIALIVLSIILFFLIKQNRLKNKIEDLNSSLEDKIEEATKDLLKAQKLAKIGSWRFCNSKNKLSWSDETYKIFEIDKTKEQISTIEDFIKYIHPDDIEILTTAYDKHIKEQAPYFITHRIVTKNGNIKYVEERCETNFSTDDNPLISNGTIQDITEKKLQENKLKEKEEQMLQQSRLAQMGEMISMIAHQWRQPLNAISLTSSNLKFKCMMDNYDKDIFEKEIDLIDEYSQHLSTTIDDFRGFFKENKEKEETSLEDIVNSTLDIVKTSVETKGITINTDLQCDEKFETYSNEIKQVVLNLIKNAEDVLLDNNTKNPTITIQTLCDETKDIKTIIVKDNGGGIPQDIKDKIFDPYFSTKKEKDGTGLGLYMSKTIIEEHCGGRLSVSNDTEGAVFEVRL